MIAAHACLKKDYTHISSAKVSRAGLMHDFQGLHEPFILEKHRLR